MRNLIALMSVFLFFNVAHLFAPSLGFFGQTSEKKIEEHSPDSLKEFCLKRCSKIIEENKPPLTSKVFNEQWPRILPVDLKEEFFSHIIYKDCLKEIEEKLQVFDNKWKEIQTRFDKKLFNRQQYAILQKTLEIDFDNFYNFQLRQHVEGLDRELIKKLYYMLFLNVNYERTKKNMQDLLLEIVDDEEEKKFINSYFSCVQSYNLNILSLPYYKDPYYVAFKQRSFLMMDYLLSIGIDFNIEYARNFGPFVRSLTANIKRETDPHDIEMQNYLTERFRIEFN